MPLILRLILVGSLLMMGCGATPSRDEIVDSKGQVHELAGQASWYGKRFQGRSTASGEPFDIKKWTAAHRTLPFQTLVRVVDNDTRKSVIVRINDRGPWSDGRVIDLSRAAAEDLDMIDRGVVSVTLEVLEWGDGSTTHEPL
jgi:rare lipoprotein A